MKILIVGAGISGCTVARCLAEKGHLVHIIEKRPHIAGNCYDEKDKNGIMVNKYGAHIFHTNSDRVWQFINRFAEWSSWYHKVVGLIDNTYFPIPVNIDTVNILCGTQIATELEMKEWLSENTPNRLNEPKKCEEVESQPKNSEEVALQRIGPYLYDKIVKHYTYKQWAKYPAELDASVLQRIPVRTTHEDGYFSDKYQALPTLGYTHFVEKMCEHENITVQLNTDYMDYINCDKNIKADIICYTGPIDQYYASHGYPKLEYRSIIFETEYKEVDQFQPNSVVNYPSPNEPYTRIVEYKHFLNQHAPGKTTIVKEYTVDEGDPYYPVPTAKNREIYEMYKTLAEEDEKKGVYFIGRLANYKYYNMDAAIENALQFSDKIATLHE
jgi:UDP-galactopyranose mutase